MEFNQRVAEIIQPFLSECGFVVVEQYKNYFHFRSAVVEATICYNELDRGSLFEIGRISGPLFPLNDNAIKQIFGLDTKVDHVTKEVFIDNLDFFSEVAAHLF